MTILRKEIQWRLYHLELYVSELLLCLQLKDVEYKFKCLLDLQRLLARNKLAHLNQLQIKHVIDEAEEQVHLTYEK